MIVVCDSTILTKKLGLIDQIQPLVAELREKNFRISEEPRASARGFFQRKSQYDLKATSVQNYTANGRRWSAIPPRSSERGILAFSRDRVLSETLKRAGE